MNLAWNLRLTAFQETRAVNSEAHGSVVREYGTLADQEERERGGHSVNQSNVHHPEPRKVAYILAYRLPVAVPIFRPINPCSFLRFNATKEVGI